MVECPWPQVFLWKNLLGLQRNRKVHANKADTYMTVGRKIIYTKEEDSMPCNQLHHCNVGSVLSSTTMWTSALTGTEMGQHVFTVVAEIIFWLCVLDDAVLRWKHVRAYMMKRITRQVFSSGLLIGAGLDSFICRYFLLI